jgi:hypothetical protein
MEETLVNGQQAVITHLCLAITKNGPFLPREPTHKTGQAVLSMKSSRIL